MPFSNREKTTTLEEEPKIEGKDFAELEAIKRELFQRIKNDQYSSIFVHRVMEHSIKDGIELANIVGYSSKDVIRQLFSKNTDSLSIKHQDFLFSLFKKISDYEIYLDEGNSEFFDDEVQSPYYFSSSGGYDNYDRDGEKYWQDQIKDGGDSGELLSDIDEYYSRFLSLRSFIKEDSLGKGRQIKIEKQKQTETEKVEGAEKSGERVLEWLQKSYEKNYETRLVKPLIWNHLISSGEFDIDVLEKELKKAGVSDEDIIKLIYTPLISFITLEGIADKIGLDLESPETTKKLEKFRWKPYQVAVRGEMGHSKRVLLNSLVDEVETKTDGKKTLVLGEDGQYKIVENTGGREKGEGKKEGIDFDNPKIEKTPKFNILPSNFTEFKGKLAYVIKEKDEDYVPNDEDYVLYDNKKIGPYDADSIKELKEIAGKLTFEAEIKGDKVFIADGLIKNGEVVYEVVGHMKELSGNFACEIKTNNGVKIILEDDRGFYNHADSYEMIGNDYILIGDTVFFSAKENGKWFIASYNKKTGENKNTSQYSFYEEQPFFFTEVAGKLAYVVKEGWKDKEGWKAYVIYNGEKYGPYDDVREIVKNSKNLRVFNSYFPKTMGDKRYAIEGLTGDSRLSGIFNPYEIENLIEVSGETCFIQTENDRKFVCHGDKKFGPYDKVYPLKEVKGKLLFVAKIFGADFIINYDGEVEFTHSSYIHEIKITDEKIVLITIKQVVEGRVIETITFDIDKLDSTSEQEFILNQDENRRLDLLNVLESIGDKTDMDIISEYFVKYYPNQKVSLKDSIKQALSGSYKVKKAITDALKDSPETFFSTMSAKSDDMSGAYIDHLVFSLFPEIRKNMREQEIKNGHSFGSSFWDNFGRAEKGGISPEDNFRGLLSGNSSSGIEGGDPLDERTVEVLKLREGMEGMVATSIYGSYHPNKWEKVDFPVSEENSGVTKEITCEIPNTYGMREIVLPKLVNAKILMDRIKGIDTSLKEINLMGEKNKLGEVKVKIPEGVTKVLYSQTEDMVPKVPTDVSQEEYDRYVRRLDKVYGEKVYESIATLPDEIRLFLASIEKKHQKKK